MAQIRVKRAMLDFPSAPPAGSLHEQIEKLLPVRPHSRISEKSFYIGERFAGLLYVSEWCLNIYGRKL